MPTSVTVTMFFLGNFADMDTDETNTNNENPNVVLGLYDDLEFIELTQIDDDDDGVISDDEFITNDTLSYDPGTGTVTSPLDNTSLYNADVLLGDGSTLSVPVLVLQAANGDVFLSEFPPSPLDGLAIQSITLLSPDTTDATGINQGFSDLENVTVVCFGPDTMIATQNGSVRAQDIQIGDLVQTLDHGLQPVLWVHSNVCSLDAKGANDKPVLISAGALGNERPAHDMIVSPQHRILVGGQGQLDTQFTREVFAPAKSLTSLPGIRHMRGKSQITWVHFAFERHEIVCANGCFAEALLLGPVVLKALPVEQQRAVRGIFTPQSVGAPALNGPPARPCLTVSSVRRALREDRSHHAPAHAVLAHQSVHPPHQRSLVA